MTGLFDNQQIDITCPKCSSKLKERLGSLLGQEQPSANAPAAADDPVTAHFAELNSIVSKNEGEPAAIDGLLERCGSDKSRIVDVTIFLADLADYEGMNEAWDAWLDRDNPPARATVQAQLANPEWKVEIKIVAAR